MRVKVRDGDSLWLYSQLFKVPIQLIQDSNPRLSNYLNVGDDVEIPGYIKESYMIKTGETMFQLARKLNIAEEALMLVNPEIKEILLPGQKVYLPKRVNHLIIDGNQKYDFNQLEKDVRTLRSIYPFLKVNTIGKSVLERPLYEIELGRGKRTLHFNASFHANEWITTPVLMKSLNEYILALTNGKKICDEHMMPLYHRTHLSIVPMVNPDGVNLVLHGPPNQLKKELITLNKGSTDFSGWKANVRGVDLNNQYPAKWEIEKERKEPKSPAPRDYPGEHPLTEPEAKAMAQLAEERRFSLLLAYHTQGREFYWGYDDLEPGESKRLAEEYEKISGYKAIQYIDSHAGYRDWFIYEYRRPGFTFELGYGVNPLPLDQFPRIYKEMLAVFVRTLQMETDSIH